MKTLGGNRRPPAPQPWRLTRRGRVALVVVSCVLASVVLALAYVTGQDARCDALRAAHDPNASAYCS